MIGEGGDKGKRVENEYKRTWQREKWLGDRFYTIDWLLPALIVRVAGSFFSI